MGFENASVVGGTRADAEEEEEEDKEVIQRGTFSSSGGRPGKFPLIALKTEGRPRLPLPLRLG